MEGPHSSPFLGLSTWAQSQIRWLARCTELGSGGLGEGLPLQTTVVLPLRWASEGPVSAQPHGVV